MHRSFLGDSYDIVKRFWGERLAKIAPLIAHPRFVPREIRREFELIVGIPILHEGRTPSKFGLFLDPDTGIPLPTSVAQTATVTHAPISFIANELERLAPRCLICFDQSHDRHCGHSKPEQRQMKLGALRAKEIACMYYVSHAPFLFAARDELDLNAIRTGLVESGIPDWRFERPLGTN